MIRSVVKSFKVPVDEVAELTHRMAELDIDRDDIYDTAPHKSSRCRDESTGAAHPNDLSPVNLWDKPVKTIRELRFLEPGKLD